MLRLHVSVHNNVSHMTKPDNIVATYVHKLCIHNKYNVSYMTKLDNIVATYVHKLCVHDITIMQ